MTISQILLTTRPYDPPWVNSQFVRGMKRQFAQMLTSIPSQSIEERFAKLVDEDLRGFDKTLETAQGIPSVQVVQRTDQVPADLVLLGKREGLGSVARGVIREAKCSVFTVPVDETGE